MPTNSNEVISSTANRRNALENCGLCTHPSNNSHHNCAFRGTMRNPGNGPRRLWATHEHRARTRSDCLPPRQPVHPFVLAGQRSRNTSSRSLITRRIIETTLTATTTPTIPICMSSVELPRGAVTEGVPPLIEERGHDPCNHQNSHATSATTPR